jgi:glycosyltransferase involved in cell wall biosynthesis
MSTSVSVIIPTFNRASYLPACFDSVLASGLPNLQVVVVDDGSTDNTAEVVRWYRSNVSSAVSYFEQRNAGPAAARNLGFRNSTGAYVCFLDSDDSWLPRGPASLLQALEAHREYGVAFGDTLMGNDGSGWTSFVETYGGAAFSCLPKRILDGEAVLLEKGPFFRQLAIRNVMFLGSLFLRRSAFERIGGFQESLCGAADWDLFLRLAAHFEVLYVSDVPVARYLKHDVAMSNDASHMNQEFMFALANVLEVAHLSAVDRQHVRRLLKRHRFDWAYQAYDAGRLDLARRRFVDAARRSGPSIDVLLYLLLSCAPTPLVQRIRTFKRFVLRRSDVC